MKKSGFGRGSVLITFDPSPYVSKGLTRSEVMDLKESFDLIDHNGTAKIDCTQLRLLIKVFNSDKRNVSLELAIDQITDTKKTIDFKGFVDIFTKIFSNDPPNYRSIFKLFDDQKMGVLSAKNLKRVVRQLNMEISQNEIEQMIQRADLNNDGVITEDQFCMVMKKISPKA